MNGNRIVHRLKTSHIARATITCALTLILLLAVSNPALAQPPADNPLHTATRMELDVVKVVLAQETAWNNGDIEAYIKGFKDSPDTYLIGKHISKGYAQILSDFKLDYLTRSSMGTLTYSELEAHPLSDTFAVCIGKYHLDRSKKEGGSADGLFSMVLEKTDQGWKIVVDHTT
jgi:ketosteroid isomerase-like protein